MERRVYEILKELHIPFKHRWLIEGREVDFLIDGKIVLELNGHAQDESKNEMLVRLGFIVTHLDNEEVTKLKVLNLINYFYGN